MNRHWFRTSSVSQAQCQALVNTLVITINGALSLREETSSKLISLQIDVAKSPNRYFEDKGTYLINELGRNFLVGDLIQGLKNKKAAIERVEKITSKDPHLFVHSTNVYSALSLSQELSKAMEI